MGERNAVAQSPPATGSSIPLSCFRLQMLQELPRASCPFPGPSGPPSTEKHQSVPLGLPATRGFSPLHPWSPEWRGCKARLQGAAAPPFCASGSAPGPRAQDGCGAASQESNGERRYRSHPPTPTDAAAIFSLPPRPVTGGGKNGRGGCRHTARPRPPSELRRRPPGPPAPRLPPDVRLPTPGRTGPRGLEGEAAGWGPRPPAHLRAYPLAVVLLAAVAHDSGSLSPLRAFPEAVKLPPFLERLRRSLARRHTFARSSKPTRSTPPPHRSNAAGCDATLFNLVPPTPPKARFPGPAHLGRAFQPLSLAGALPKPDVTSTLPPCPDPPP